MSRPYLGITITNVSEGTELYFVENTAMAVTTEAPGKKYYYYDGHRVYLPEDATTVIIEKTGLYVKDVNKDSGCYEIVLRGDIITAFDGQTLVYDAENGLLPDITVFDILKTKKAGDKVKLTVYRNGETVDLTVTLSAKK